MGGNPLDKIRLIGRPRNSYPVDRTGKERSSGGIFVSMKARALALIQIPLPEASVFAAKMAFGC